MQTTWYTGDAVYVQTGTGSAVPQEYAIDGGSGRIGTFYRQDNVYAYELRDQTGNVRAVVAKSGSSLEVRGYSDYYPYGMVLRSGGTDYRYGYQGAYAEKDGETDWNAFELRMYDSRIARWMTTDPKKQYASPYVGMADNPISGVDKDGGEDHPIYVDGKFVGTDDQGFNGEPLLLTSAQYNLDLSESDRFQITAGTFSSFKSQSFETLGAAINNVKSYEDFKTISMVFNDVASKTEMTGALKGFNMNMLHNGQISTTQRVFDPEYKTTKAFYQYNNGYESSDGVVNTVMNKVTFQLEYWNGEKGNLIPTVADIQNDFVHEAGGHFFNKLHSYNDATKKGILNHIKVYEMQMAHSSWLKTTSEFKSYMNDNLKDLNTLLKK